MKSTIKKMLPPPLLRRGRRYLEAREMAQEPRLSCDPREMARPETLPLADVFEREDLAAEWEEVVREMARLDITTEAGGVNPGDRRAIWSLIRGLAPARVLEVGTHIGASTAFIAIAQRALAAEGRPSQLVTVDLVDVNDPATAPWRSHGASRSPRELMAEIGREGEVHFVARSSVDFLDASDERFDLIFLDGSHEAKHVYPEIPRAVNHLAPGGFILLHDYFPGARPLWSNGHVLPGVWLAIERLRREGLPLAVRPLGELPWPTKLGSRVTSLAILGRGG